MLIELAILLLAASVSVIVISVASLIDSYLIAKKAKEEYKKSAKAIIQSTSIKEVTVGIYDDDTKVKELRIISDEGVSCNLREGQIISL